MKNTNNLLKKLKNDINKFFNVSIEHGTKTNDEVYARMIYYKLYKIVNPVATLTEIGLSVNKNHATVIHSLKNFNLIYEYDKRFKYMYDNFMINNPQYLQKMFLKEQDVDIIESLLSTITFVCNLNFEDGKNFINELETLKKLFTNNLKNKWEEE